MSSWQLKLKKEMNREKYIKSPMDLKVNVEKPPREVIRKGKFGDRTLYVIWDEKIGAILLSTRQFMVLAQAIGDLTKGIIEVTV